MSSSTSSSFSVTGAIHVIYHPVEDSESVEYTESQKSHSTLDIHHSHPSPTKTIELVASAIREKNLSQAATIIEAVGICSTRIACNQGRGGFYERQDPVLLKKIAKDDSQLQMLLLKMYQEALSK